MPPKKALGKGLANLLGDIESSSNGKVQEIPIEKILPNPKNPRKKFHYQGIEELASTIQKHGILQPILVTPAPEGKYMIISGERRYRAAKIAGLKSLPAIIKKVDSLEHIELSLIENIQREELDPIEEAIIYQELMEKYQLTQEEIAKRVGKSRSFIANRLRLLQLPEEIQVLITDGLLSEGQVRPLISIKNPSLRLQLARDIHEKKLSAREVEKLVKKYQKSTAKSSKKKEEEILKLEEKLIKKFQAPVSISYNPKTQKGKITFYCHSKEEMEALLKKWNIRYSF